MHAKAVQFFNLPISKIWSSGLCRYIWMQQSPSYFPPGHLSFYFIHNKTRFPCQMKLKFTSRLNVSLLCFLTRTSSTSPQQFFHLPHQPFEQSVLHWHLIILRIFWVAVTKSVTTGINFFEFTAQRHSVALRLLPFLYCVIWKYVCKLWYLNADLVVGSVSGLTKGFFLVPF